MCDTHPWSKKTQSKKCSLGLIDCEFETRLTVPLRRRHLYGCLSVRNCARVEGVAFAGWIAKSKIDFRCTQGRTCDIWWDKPSCIRSADAASHSSLKQGQQHHASTRTAPKYNKYLGVTSWVTAGQASVTGRFRTGDARLAQSPPSASASIGGLLVNAASADSMR